MRDAVDSLYNGKLTGKRTQTVLSPKLLVEPIRVLFGGSIQKDPVWAPGSHTEPVEKVELPWDDLWDATAQRAQEFAARARLDPAVATDAIRVLRAEVPTKDAAKGSSVLARRVRKAIREEYGHLSGHRVDWPDGTYCNPPFGDRGPEVLLADFRDFCAKFASTKTECAFLSPVRTHRKWWRRDVLMSSTAVVLLNPLMFDGFPQTFPAPLALAYRGSPAKVEILRREFSHLGDVLCIP